MQGRTWSVVVTVIASAAGCGFLADDDAEPLDVPTPEESSVAAADRRELAVNEYLVEPGDTLWRIAEEACGDPWAYVDIFNQNVGRIQDDDDALVAPDLIETGWILLVECPTPEDREFQEAPPDEEVTVPPSTVAEEPVAGDSGEDASASTTEPSVTESSEGGPEPAPATIELQPVPENEVVVDDTPDAPGSRPASDIISSSCNGTTTLPMIVGPKAVLRAGETAEARLAYHGQVLGITVEGISDPITVRLIDDRGSTLEFAGRPGGFFDLFVDAGLPSGAYVVEAAGSSGTPAYMRLEVRPPPTPDLIRQSNDEPIEFLLVGASDVAADVYRQKIDGCTESWEYWQHVGELGVNTDGNGRVVIPAATSLPGRYCLTFDNSDDITGQCDVGRQRFTTE